jgi:hypothetical protein
VDRSHQQTQQPSPRVQAVQAAAAAADAHAAAPDSVTLRTLQQTVQAAVNLGAHVADIRAARTTAVNA